jgi:hypothetical protein
MKLAFLSTTLAIRRWVVAFQTISVAIDNLS